MDSTRSLAVRSVLLALTLLTATLSVGAVQQARNRAPRETLRFASPPDGPVTFRGQLDRSAVLAGGDGRVMMELVLGAEAPAGEQPVRRPTDLIVVLDRSGSMRGAKIAHARNAILELLRHLEAADRFALVSYARHATAPIRLSPRFDPAGSDRFEAWRAVLTELPVRGGTNLAAGLDLALEQVDSEALSQRMTRVVLVSDGLANEGDTSEAGLRSRAERAARGEFALSTVGVGEQFDEHLLAALADAGTGNYYSLRDSDGLDDVLAGEFAAARRTVARGVTVRIRPRPGVEVLDAAGYPLHFGSGGEVSFQPGPLFVGQQRRLWVTLKVAANGTGSIELGEFGLEYGARGRRFRTSFETVPRVARVHDRARFHAAIDPEAWARSVADDAIHALRQKVSSSVREGRRAEAVEEIEAFRTSAHGINRALGLASVDAKLEEAKALEEAVNEAFEGSEPEQSLKRNRLSKDELAAGLGGRRVGAAPRTGEE